METVLLSSIVGTSTLLTSLTLEHPFDVLKTRSHVANRKVSFFTISSEIMLQKGYRGFYAGFSVNAFRVAVKNIYRWPLITHLPLLFRRFTNDEMHIRLYTGLTIANIEVFILNPLERTKVFMISSISSVKVKQVCCTLHFSDYFTGIQTYFLKQNLSWISFLTLNKFFVDRLGKNYKEWTLRDVMHVSVPMGLINTTLTMPLDFVKSIQQKDLGKAKGISEVMANTVKEQGASALFRGSHYRLIQYNIQSFFGTYLLSYLEEQVKERHSRLANN